jgi:hypothetical protein
VCAALASAALVASYFLPWVEIPEASRPRVAAGSEAGIHDLEPEDAALAERARSLVRAIAERGELTGIEVFQYARFGHDLNAHLKGDPPAASREDREWMVSRAYALGAVVLGVLPLAAVGLVLLFALQRFRKAGTVALVVLVLAGCLGAAVTLGWLRFTQALQAEVFTGFGMRLALAASVLQACIGLVGVDTRNWWRVYASSIASVALFGLLAWAYVSRGAMP